MKESSIFSAGHSNFAMLMSDSEASDGSEQESVHELGAEAVEEKLEEQTEEVEDEWQPVVGKKQKAPSTLAAGKPAAARAPTSGKVSYIGNGTKKMTAGVPHVPVALDEIKPTTALELHGFPSKYRTGHLRKFVDSVTQIGYRLKWQNDSSCWVVFDEPAMLERALAELKDEFIQVRPFAEENLVISADETAAEPTA